MKSKYIKIFMIIAVVFAMVAGLFVSPALVHAEEEATEVTVDAKVQHDLDAIEASLPANAVISFPVTYKSVYDNIITWAVQEGQEVITYDEDAHWMVVDRSKVAGESQKVTLTYTVNDESKTKTYTVTKGETIAPTYTITYDCEVSEEAVKEYKLGQATFNLPTLTDENKIFLGWIEEGNEDVVLTKVLVGTMKDLVLKAKWQNQYTVSFGNDAQSLTVNAGDEITLPECTTEKEGNTFDGWKLGETTYEAGATVVVTEDMQFAAVWKANKYTLTFMNGNDVVRSTDVEFGATITVPADPTKTGYTFAGWDAKVPATMPASNLTFNAQWNIVEYTITYTLNGGTLAQDAPIVYTVEEEVELPAVSKEGHEFLGWYLGEEKVEKVEVGTTGNLELVAQWKANKYTLTFMNGNDVVRSTDVEFGAAITVPADPTKIGYTFTGWDANVPATMPASNLTFNATWEVVEYSITYTLNGGTLPQGAPTVYTVESADIVLAAATRVGFTFEGYYLDGELLENNTIDTSLAKNLTIELKWKNNMEVLVEADAEALAEQYKDVLTGELATFADQLIVLGKNGSTIEWLSDSTAVSVSNEGVVTIARPTNGNETVTLTALVSQSDETTSYTRYCTFTFEVLQMYEVKNTDSTVVVSNLEEELTLTATEITAQDVNANYQIASADYVAAYDITLSKNDQNVSTFTNGVTVKIKLPEAILTANDIIVYHINGETKEEVKNIKVEDGYVVFTATSFSPYLVVKKHVHSYTSVVTAPTCTEAGFTTHTCSCGDTYVNTPVAATGHTEVVDAAKEATCTETGLTEGKHCSVCNVTIVEQTVIPAKNHAYGEVSYTWSEDNKSVIATRTCQNDQTHVETETVKTTYQTVIEATCTTKGTGKYTAQFTNAAFTQQTKDVDLPTLEHEYTSVVTAPTCTVDGYTTYTCDCGDSYTDDIVSATGHDFVNGECACGESDPNYVPEPQEITIAEALSIIDSLADGEKTTVKYLVSGQIVEVKNTTYGNVYISDGTNQIYIYGLYNEDGTVQYNSLDVKPQLGDTITVLGVLLKYKNSNTSEITPEIEKGWIIELDVHECNKITVDGYEATCTTAGKTAGEICSICKKVITEQTDIPALGHVDINEDNSCDRCGTEIASNDDMSEKTETYLFANYPAGTQYADNEEHELDSYITITTTQAHFTTQLRLYSSSTNDAFAIIECNGLINGLAFNAGYKEDTLNVYGSNDGDEWTPIEGVSITSTSYEDYTVAGTFEYKYIKLDVAGSQQIRIASITVSFKYEECKHTELENVDGQEPTCTEVGYTAGIICSSCKEVQSGVEEIPATGHNYNSVVTDPTCTVAGYTTHTCSYCNDSYQDTVVQALGHDFDSNGECTRCDATEGEATPVLLATFALGADGSATHKDGSSDKATYTETVGDYTLNITGGSKMYPDSIDAKGNGALKFGSSSAAGKMTITVDEKVTKVVIYVAGYKANTAKLTINGTSYTVSTPSNDGNYTAIEIDTTTTKTISFATVSGGYRAMVNTIEFYGTKQ